MKGPYAEDSGDTETTRYESSSLTIDLSRFTSELDRQIDHGLGSMMV